MRRLRTIRMGLHHPVGAQIVDLFLHFVILTCLMSANLCVFHFTCFTRDLGQRSGPCHAKGMMEEKNMCLSHLAEWGASLNGNFPI